MSDSAVVIGATGAVGSSLVRELLASPRWSAVGILVRRATDVFDGAEGASKLRVHVIDMTDAGSIEKASSSLTDVSAAFCTMGLGQPRKVSDAEFWKVDVEFAGAFARGVARAGAQHVSLLSSTGADETSRTRYLKVKGAAEAAVRASGAKRVSLFRPSLLVTKEIRYGMQDRLTQALFPIVAPLLPSNLHQIKVEDLARAMRINAEIPGDGVQILHYSDFQRLLAREPR